ncbi:MAG: hypothetical protein ABIB61_04040 [Candidatus Shapirobacteria bacterium]
MKKIYFLLIFFLYLKVPYDTDLGWHLRYGQQIFFHHQVFKTNQIGYFLANYSWKQAYSLYQLTTFAIFHYFSFAGLIIANAFLMLAIFYPFFALYRKRDKLTLLFSSIFLVVSFQSIVGLGWRSQLFTLLGFSLVYYLILKTGRKKYFFLPLVFFLWAILHGGFVFGFALLILCLLELILQKNKKQAQGLAAALFLSFLVTLANPFGFGLYQEIYRHTWYPLNKLILEWTPPDKFGLLIVFASSCLTLLALLAKRGSVKILKRNNFFLLSSWLVFLFLSLKARRNLAFFSLSSVHLWLQLFKRPAFLNKKLANPTFAIILGSVFVYKAFRLPSLKTNWNTLCQASFWPPPCQATEFLKEKPENFCQNLFNAYEWGGYLSWHLPNKKTFIDGRMPAWATDNEKSPYTTYLEILQTQIGFNKKLIDYKTDCLLIGNGTFLDLELKKHPYLHPWKKIYEDQQAVIYQYQEIIPN